jgi:opacity protein-like surface antigen
MKTFLTCFTLLVGILVFSFRAEAEVKEKGFFIGAGLSYAWENFDEKELEGISRDANIDNSWGVNIYGGYKFIKYLAVEGNFNWYADFDGKADGEDFDISIWTLMLDLKVMSPLLWNDRLSPYVKGGGGYMVSEVDAKGSNTNEEDFAFNLGGGFDVFVTDQVSVGLDGKYVWGTGDVDDFNHYVGAIRVGFHF